MKIYAAFVKNPNPIMIGARAIEWAEKIDFSHTAIILEDNDGLIEVYESVWPKSRKMPMSKWLAHYRLKHIYKFEAVDEKQFLEMKQFLNDRIGVFYSVWQLVVIGLTFIAPLEKLLTGRVVNGSKRLICTELVGDFFIKFFDCKWFEPTDTISLTETKDEIVRKWKQQNGSISDT